MRDQEFIDIKLDRNESLGTCLQDLVTRRREELGTHGIYVQDVISTKEDGYTIVLEVNQAPY